MKIPIDPIKYRSYLQRAALKRKETKEMVKVKRINPEDAITFEITALPEVWRCVVVAVGSQNFFGGNKGILKELYDALHAEVYELKG